MKRRAVVCHVTGRNSERVKPEVPMLGAQLDFEGPKPKLRSWASFSGSILNNHIAQGPLGVRQGSA